MTHRQRLQRVLLVLAALAIFATACGGGGASGDPVVAGEAEANEAQLNLGGNIAETQLLNANTGEISSLGDVVTGDRAVLAWYWAPH